MTILEHLQSIEQRVGQIRRSQSTDVLLAIESIETGMSLAGSTAHWHAHSPWQGVGSFNMDVPWEQITPHSMSRDSDGDGIPDALDNHWGPGA